MSKVSSLIADNKKKTAFGGLLALMVAIATPIYIGHEGEETLPYQDIVGVWTVCSGDTRNVEPGIRLTEEECAERTQKIMEEYGTAVAKVNPSIVNYPYQWAAHTIFAANIGVGGYSRSSILRLDKAGKHRLACRALRKYKYAGGKVVIGLVNRREGTDQKVGEYELCLADAVERDIKGE